MIFKLNENESIELKYSFRSNIYFEQITKHSLNFENMSSDDFITLFYCVVIASLQKAKQPVITMLDFMDKIDDFNGGEKCLMSFSEWYISIIKSQYEVLDDGKEVKEESNQKKRKKV